MNWDFYADPGATVLLATVGLAQATNIGAADHVVYYANPTAGYILQNGAAPGVDPVEISVVDAAAGSGLAESVLTLALSPGDLDTNTPGDPLPLGATLNSGVANVLPIYLRLDAGAAAAGVYTDLLFRVANRLVSAV